MMTLCVAPDLAPLVRLGVVQSAPVAIAPSGPQLLAEIEEACREHAAAHAGQAPGEIAGIQVARTLYRSFGIDPTRTRPSSEALLRRVLAGKPFPLISNAVDLGNLAALKFLLSLGLYDVQRLVGPIRLRRGEPGESYPGIRKEEVHLAGRPALADEQGAFGNPTSDSLRASVSEGTRELLTVFFAPKGDERELFAQQVEWYRAAVERHLAPAGGKTISETMLL